MNEDDLNELGKKVISAIRDPAISNLDKYTSDVSNSLVAIQLRKAKSKTEALHALIPVVVDSAVFCLLNAMNAGAINFLFVANDGRQLPIHVAGPVQSCYRSWISNFSVERNDLSDLAEGSDFFGAADSASTQMSADDMNDFGRTVVCKVRDLAIRSNDVGISKRSNSPSAKRFRNARSVRQAVYEAISDCVNTAIFQFLHAIDSGALKLHFVTNDGRQLDLYGDGYGELGGWFFCWIESFSKERNH
jgi:hypothetical protein